MPSAKAYFYLAGTTTPVNVYADVGLTTPLTQPVVADASNGSFVEIFLTPGTAYKVDVQTSAGVSLAGYPADNQLAIPQSSTIVAFTGTAGETLTAGQAVYLSDGSGGKNAGQWYKADATNTYSSTLPEVGMVPSSITVGATGLIQQGGQVAGLVSLSVGADYFISTAGAITTTGPTNARFIGRADTTSTLILGPNQAVKGQTFVSPVIGTSLLTPAVAGLGFGVCQGRLTLTSGTAVTSADVTGATSIFFTPYLGNNIGLYDGSTNWAILPFAELTLALGTLTSGLPYDVFAYNNAGAVALRAPVAWTNGTTRATALILQNGIWVKTGATTDRYLGTFYTTSTTQTEDSKLKRFLGNYYNPKPRPLAVQIATASWTYDTATPRQANGTAANKVEFISAAAETAVDLFYLSPQVRVTDSSGAQYFVLAGIGLDTTSAFTVNATIQVTATSAFQPSIQGACRYADIPAVGYHFASLNEQGTGQSFTTTWFGSGTYAGGARLNGVVWN